MTYSTFSPKNNLLRSNTLKIHIVIQKSKKKKYETTNNIYFL